MQSGRLQFHSRAPFTAAGLTCSSLTTRVLAHRMCLCLVKHLSIAAVSMSDQGPTLISHAMAQLPYMLGPGLGFRA